MEMGPIHAGRCQSLKRKTLYPKPTLPRIEIESSEGLSKQCFCRRGHTGLHVSLGKSTEGIQSLLDVGLTGPLRLLVDVAGPDSG